MKKLPLSRLFLGFKALRPYIRPLSYFEPEVQDFRASKPNPRFHVRNILDRPDSPRDKNDAARCRSGGDFL